MTLRSAIVFIICVSILWIIICYFSDDIKEEFCSNRNCERLMLPSDPINLLTTPNLPHQPSETFRVPASANNYPDNLAATEGKYCFTKPKLLYDGVWDKQSTREGKLEKSNWIIPKDKNPSAGVYCINDFLKLPDFNMSNILIHTANDCQMIDTETELIRKWCPPDFIDKYGYVQP